MSKLPENWRNKVITLLFLLAVLMGLMFSPVRPAYALTAYAPTLNPTTVNTLAKYTINGKTGTGDLVVGDTITIILPNNTTVPSSVAAANVTVQGTDCTVAPTCTPAERKIVVTTPVAIAKNTNFTVVIGKTSNVITNPSVPGTTYTHTLATSKEPTPVTSASYSITASSTQVTAATVTPSPGTTGSTAAYTINFNVGSAGALTTSSAMGASKITIIFPSDTTVPTSPSASNVTVNGTACSTVTTTPAQRKVEITTPVNVANGGSVSIVFASAFGLVNPTTKGSYTLTVSTSAETTATTSNSYSVRGNPHGVYSDSTNWCRDCHAAHGAVGSVTIVSKTPNIEICYACHDGTGSNFDIKSIFQGTAHDTTVIPLPCTGCHYAHGVGYTRMTKGAPLEENLCYLCHGSTPKYGADNIQTEATKTYRHPTGDYSGRHSATETASSHNLTNRHAECRDCHHYHKPKKGTHYMGGGPRRASGNPIVTVGSSSGSYTDTTASDDVYWQGAESSALLGARWESWDAFTDAPAIDITQIKVIMEGNASSTDDYWYIRFYDYSISNYSSTWYQIGPNGWPGSDAEYSVTISDVAVIQKYINSSGNFKIDLACGRLSGQGPMDTGNNTRLYIDYFGVEFTITAGTPKGNWSSKPLKEVWGAEPNNYTTPPAPTAPSETLQDNITYTTANPITREYQLCLKCHCSYAYGATPPAGQTDKAKEINPNNYSFMPVYGSANNSYCNALTMESPWNRRSSVHDTMYCSDCHGSDNVAAPKGPHGSNNQYMLRGFGPGSYSFDNLCLKCHKESVYKANSALSRFGQHGANNHPYGDGKNILGCTACHGGPADYADLTQNSNRPNGGRVGAIHGENFKWKNPDNTETPAKYFLVGGYDIGIRLDDFNAEGNMCWSYGKGVGGDPCSSMVGGKQW